MEWVLPFFVVTRKCNQFLTALLRYGIVLFSLAAYPMQVFKQLLDLNFLNELSYAANLKIKSKDYSNKLLREKSYQALVEHCQKFEATADKEFVVKKISNLRNAYRKQLKKIHSSKLSGAGTEDIADPTLWYFELLDFLQDQETQRPAVSNIQPTFDRQEQVNIEEESALGQEDTCIEIDVVSPSPQNLALSEKPHAAAATPAPTPSTSASTSRSAKRKAPADTASEILTLARERLLNAPQTAVREGDRFDSFGKAIADKLRSVSHEQNIHAQKLISDVLYEAELGSLSRGTVTYNRATPVLQPEPQANNYTYDIYQTYE